MASDTDLLQRQYVYVLQYVISSSSDSCEKRREEKGIEKGRGKANVWSGMTLDAVSQRVKERNAQLYLPSF